MATAIAEGTQTATVGTEHILWEDLAANGTYQLVVNLQNLAIGETVELRIYRSVLSTDAAPSLYAVWRKTRTGADIDVVAVSTAVLTTRHLRFTLRQINGTARSFRWVVEKA